MDILKIATMYKADRYNNIVSPEKKEMLDSICDSAIDSHIDTLEGLIYDIQVCMEGNHKDSAIRGLKTQIREFKEWRGFQLDSPIDNLSDLSTINKIRNK